MKLLKYFRLPAVFFAVFLLFCSCFGMTMDIEFRQNGSGTVSLEYRVSKSLDSLGKLDGNERWNTIPLGKADFERTLSRLPEMKLLSYSSKEDDKDVIFRVKMEFSSINGLLEFLDGEGLHSSFSEDPAASPSKQLNMTLSSGSGSLNTELMELVKEVSASHAIKVSASFPGEGVLSVFDNNKAPLETQKRGKKVTCSFPLYDVLSSGSGINLELKW